MSRKRNERVSYCRTAILESEKMHHCLVTSRHHAVAQIMEVYEEREEDHHRRREKDPENNPSIDNRRILWSWRFLHDRFICRIHSEGLTWGSCPIVDSVKLFNHGPVSKSIPSISMLINRICIAFNGLLRPNIVLREMSASADTAVLSWKARKC